jgi:phosphatidylserine decarboxylase
MKIQVWDRKNQIEFTEQVYGDAWIRRLYGNSIGYFFTDQIFSRKWLSQLYGSLQSSSWSAKKVPHFIQNFQIPMQEFENGPFASFNDFFIRKFRPGQRPFPETPSEMGSFAESRMFAFAEEKDSLKIKGIDLSPASILGKEYSAFQGGPCLLARLCPVDYHRFHYPDSGETVAQYRQTGKLHSVNPLALEANPKLFLQNERHVSILKTKNFGTLAYVEVGALCVGKIIQTHAEKSFQRGEEKGYFLFGGSTVIVFGEKGAWLPDKDLLERSKNGMETLVRLGEPVAKKLGTQK